MLTYKKFLTVPRDNTIVHLAHNTSTSATRHTHRFSIMLSLSSRAIFALSIGLTSAFKLEFFQGRECTSADNGVTSISLTNDRCDSTDIGSSASVYVTLEDSDSLMDTVSFSSSTNCDVSKVITAGNSGCVDLYGTDGTHAQSFNVISGQGGDKRKMTKRNTPGSSAIEEKLSRREAVQAETTSSIEPLVRNIVHGQTFDWQNNTYRYVQIFHDTFHSVLAREWDDAIHIADDTPFPEMNLTAIFGPDSENVFGDFFSPKKESPLEIEARQFRNAVCAATRQCGQIIYRTPQGLQAVGDLGIAAAYTAWQNKGKAGTKLWGKFDLNFKL